MAQGSCQTCVVTVRPPSLAVVHDAIRAIQSAMTAARLIETATRDGSRLDESDTVRAAARAICES